MPVVSFDYVEKYEQMRAEVERLRAALEQYRDELRQFGYEETTLNAIAALEGKQ